MESITNSDIIAASSVVVALCALGTTLWQGRVMRQHNMLSVKPHVVVHVSNHMFMEQKISFKNSGLGPAILKRIEISIGNTTHELRTISDYDALERTFVTPGLTRENRFLAIDDESALASGDEYQFLSFMAMDKRQDISREFRAWVKNIKIELYYEDIYGNLHNSSFSGSSFIA